MWRPRYESLEDVVLRSGIASATTIPAPRSGSPTQAMATTNASKRRIADTILTSLPRVIRGKISSYPESTSAIPGYSPYHRPQNSPSERGSSPSVRLWVRNEAEVNLCESLAADSRIDGNSPAPDPLCLVGLLRQSCSRSEMNRRTLGTDRGLPQKLSTSTCSSSSSRRYSSSGPAREDTGRSGSDCGRSPDTARSTGCSA